MRKRVSVFLVTSLLAAIFIPTMVNAANVKKKYINIAKDGEQATQSDLGNIAINYGQIQAKLNSIIYDYVGNAHGWYVGNGVAKVEGPNGFGQALRFDTTPYTGVKLPDGSVKPDGLNDFTSEGWVKSDGIGFSVNASNRKGGWGNLIGFGSVGEVVLLGTVNGKIAVYIHAPSIGSTNSVYINTSGDIPTNRWVHIAATRKNDKIQFYMDGKPFETEKTLSGLAGKTINLGYHPFRALGYDNTTADEYVGDVDELRLWNVARTPEQIIEYYNKPLPANASSQGLIGYWNFDN